MLTISLLVRASARLPTAPGISTSAGITTIKTMNSERLTAVPSAGALKKASPISRIQAGSSTLRRVLTDMRGPFPDTTLTLRRCLRCSVVHRPWFS